MSPRIMEASLSSGVTTILGQEFGPVWGVGVDSPWALRPAFEAFDAWPINVGFLARGSSSRPEPLVEALVEGGACGFKVHEDRAPTAARWTPHCGWPRTTTCKSRCTATDSTRACRWRTPSRSSRGAQSTLSTSRAAVVVTSQTF